MNFGPMIAPVFVFLWSTGFIGAKYGLPYAEPLTLLSVRFWITAATLALWAAAMGLARPGWLRWPQRRLWAELALVGALMHGVYLGGVFTAIHLGLSAGVAALITGLNPVFTALFSAAFHGERLRAPQWLGMALGVLGVALVVSRKLEAGVGDWRGAALCLIAALSMSVAAIRQRRHLQTAPLVGSNVIQFASAAALCGVAALFLEELRMEWTTELTLAMAWLVIVLSFGAVSLLYLLLRRGEASSVTSLLFLVPGVTAMIAWAMFGERLGPPEILGVVTASVGFALVSRPPARRVA